MNYYIEEEVTVWKRICIEAENDEDAINKYKEESYDVIHSEYLMETEQPGRGAEIYDPEENLIYFD